MYQTDLDTNLSIMTAFSEKTEQLQTQYGLWIVDAPRKNLLRLQIQWTKTIALTQKLLQIFD